MNEGINVIGPRINEILSSNYRDTAIKPSTILPSNLGGFPSTTARPLKSTTRHHSPLRPRISEDRSRESASRRLQARSVCTGPCALGYHYCVGYGLFIVCRSLNFSDYPVPPLWVLSLCLRALSYAYGPFCFMSAGPLVYAYGPFH